MDFSKFKIVGAVWLFGTLLIHGLVVWHVRDLLWKGYPDFTIYYTAGTMVRTGIGPELYSDAEQFRVQREFAPNVATRLGALPFNHPPFEALLFVPFSCFSYRDAYLLWCVVNLAILVSLPFLLRPHVPVLAAFPLPIWTIAALAFFPVFFGVLQGQDSILLLLVYTLTFRALQANRLIWAGAWLACGLFKFHLVLPFLVLLVIQAKTLPRIRKILYGFTLVAALYFVVSLAIVGTRQLLSYPEYVLGLEATMAKGAIMPADMPNVRGLLYLIAPTLPHFNLTTISMSGIVFLIAAWGARFGHNQALIFSGSLCSTVLVSYHALGYDLCVLLLALLLVIPLLQGEGSGRECPRRAVFAGWILLLFSPLQLVLLMRYNRLGWISIAVLLCFFGLQAEVTTLGSARVWRR